MPPQSRTFHQSIIFLPSSNIRIGFSPIQKESHTHTTFHTWAEQHLAHTSRTTLHTLLGLQQGECTQQQNNNNIELKIVY